MDKDIISALDSIDKVKAAQKISLLILTIIRTS